MVKKKPVAPQRDIAFENLKGFVVKASDIPEPEFISTGHLALDLAIGHGLPPDKVDFENGDIDPNNPGGLPLGKLAEIFGTEGSGKSSIAYRVVGFAQKMGYNCLWIDAENSFSRDLADINGVDLEKLCISSLTNIDDPDKLYYAEDILENICTACKSGFQVIVLDSVAALSVKAEMEHQLGEGGVGMGALAQLMSRAVKKVCNYAAKYNCLVIMINQLREKIGVMFGNPETTPGGKALKFHASVRLRFQRQMSKDGQVTVEDDSGEENVIAGRSYVKIEKNRFGKPVQDSILIPIYYEKYFPDIEQILFDAGRQTKLISVRKGVYSWGEIKEEGRAKFIQAVKDKKLAGKLAEEIREQAKEAEILLPPEVLQFEGEKPKKAKDEPADETAVSGRRKAKDSTGEQAKSVETGGKGST